MVNSFVGSWPGIEEPATLLLLRPLPGNLASGRAASLGQSSSRLDSLELELPGSCSPLSAMALSHKRQRHQAKGRGKRQQVTKDKGSRPKAAGGTRHEVTKDKGLRPKAALGTRRKKGKGTRPKAAT